MALIVDIENARRFHLKVNFTAEREVMALSRRLRLQQEHDAGCIAGIVRPDGGILN